MPDSLDVSSALVFEELLARYAEPHRRYHDRRHLAEVMAAIDLLEVHARDPETVRLAAWFHDAIYEPLAPDNEERSAQLALDVLVHAGLPVETGTEVARLVRVTAAHAPETGDADAEVLCDADLAILGSDRQRYDSYRAAVREEYAAVPEDAFRSGRAAVLRGLLARPAIYRTVTGTRRWESAARANLERELVELDGTE